MRRLLKLGKYIQYDTYNCIYCNKNSKYPDHSNFIANWLCKDCENKLKFKTDEEVYFLKENRDLNKLEVIEGMIDGISGHRELTYNISFYNDFNSPQTLYVLEDHIFYTKEEALEDGKKYGEIADDLEASDYHLMRKQSKLYEQISKFLRSDEAIKFNITGIDVNIENGYINAEWKFGERYKGDVKNDLR